MVEHQNIEWKSIWKDDFLEWICGYANSEGGTLFIGKDDRGNIVGIDNYKELLERLPNKMRSLMGIKPDIYHRVENGKHYLEIVADSYPSPISLRGRYYSRSGSVTTELTGKVLDAFLLKRFGKTWDSLPVPSLAVSDLKSDAITLFRKKSLESGRLSKEDLDVSDELLLKNLRLINDDKMTLAAVMMFHEDPEQWVGNAYIKIGYFGKSDADLLFQDEIHGPLIEQVDKAIDLIYQKYLKAYIWYKDIQRVETFMFPRIGLRELVLNSVQHKAYDQQVPIQISIYPGQIYIWNIGELPDAITAERIYDKHPSLPRNPSIANVFFKTGMVESWGRGYEKVAETCRDADIEVPKVKADFSGLMVHITESKKHKELRLSYEGDSGGQNGGQNGGQSTNKKMSPAERKVAVLAEIKTDPSLSSEALAQRIGQSKRSVERSVKELRDEGAVTYVGSSKSGYWEINEGGKSYV